MSLPSDAPYGGVGPASGGYPTGAPPQPAGGPNLQRQQPSTTDVAKDQVGEVAGTARDAGKHVAGVASEQAGQVASEATQQVKQLVAQTRGELTDQAASQQQRIAGGLRSLSEELSTMARGSERSGMATDLVHQASERTNTIASWLEQREPGHVLDEVTRFARQRPGMFLALAAGAGLLVGRLGRSLKAASADNDDAAPQAPVNNTGAQRYALPPQPEVPAYPPTPTYGQSGAYEAESGYPAPPPAPIHPPQPPAYQQPQTPGYQPPQPYSQPSAPGRSQRFSGRDLTP